MLEDVFGDAAVADDPDHARVFSLVREDLASGPSLPKRMSVISSPRQLSRCCLVLTVRFA